MPADLNYSYSGLTDEEKRACRVCGLLDPPPYFPYGEDGFSWDFDICDCCGVMHGYEDITVEGARAYRQQWLAAGGVWQHPSSQPSPEQWDLQQQLSNIPTPFK
ncbi:hypothetical protein K7W42_01355 [Deinococcus sp. HMF7604]|uniref:hypothetical protein n=1 Tax=Deinococcus betulae TaxID=2873312 RepID=UPI001CCD5432|nr:hypothetical protein [Deinococcus betulae]MBZ9749500.1 hypothetical protein [Deinococcus betulae]